jgi:MtrB/PioB family decaheme-associated outer membrane protein
MRNQRSTTDRLLRVLGSAAALLALSPAQAQDAGAVDTSGWKCEECPFEDGKVDADVEAGAGNVDGADAKFGDYTGLDEEGAYAVLAGSASQQFESGTYWSFDALDLGLDARSATLEGGRAGRAELELSYEQLPHTIFDTTSTPFLGAGSATLDLPAGFVRAGTTSQMSTLGASLNPFDIGYDRDLLGLTADVRLGKHWWTSVEYRRQKRDGTLGDSGNFGFSALEFPQPLEDTTDGVVLALEYGGERLTGRLAYEGSFYSNKNTALTWDNPYPGTPTGRSALAPDNSAQYVDASLLYRFGRRSTLSLTAAMGRLEQDDAFLPFATDPTLSQPLPRTSLDGQVDTTQLGLVFTTDLGEAWSALQGLRMRADVRYDDRDNGTAQDAYNYVVSDTFPSGPVTNLPYDLEHLRYGLSGTWNLRHVLHFLPENQQLQLSGAWRHDEIKRTLQDADKTREDTAWGRLQYRPLAWLDFAVKLGAANRDMLDFSPTSVLAAPQNPLMRKFYLADRERDFAEGELTITPTDSLSFTATGRYLDDDYINSEVGLQLSRTAGATLAANWTFSEAGAALWAHYGWDEIDSRQRGSSSFSAPDWTATNEDTLRSGSLGVRLPQLGPKLAVAFEVFVANTDGEVITTSTAVSTAPLPNTRTRMNGGELSADYQWNPALTVHARLRYEHFDADDWQLDGVDAATVPTLLSLGADAYDYDAKLIELSFTYRFGAPPAQAEKSAEPAE